MLIGLLVVLDPQSVHRESTDILWSLASVRSQPSSLWVVEIHLVAVLPWSSLFFSVCAIWYEHDLCPVFPQRQPVYVESTFSSDVSLILNPDPFRSVHMCPHVNVSLSSFWIDLLSPILIPGLAWTRETTFEKPAIRLPRTYLHLIPWDSPVRRHREAPEPLLTREAQTAWNTPPIPHSVRPITPQLISRKPWMGHSLNEPRGID